MTTNSTPESWDEVVQWVWKAGVATLFVPYIKDHFLWYYLVGEENETHTRWVDITERGPDLFEQFTRTEIPNPRCNFHGPQLPPLPPVIKKIRVLEKRFQERTCCV